MDAFYSTPAWRRVREQALARDGHRCTVSRLLGGACSGLLHVHHIEARRDRPDLELDIDNVATTCALHHARWDALRRALNSLRADDPHDPIVKARRVIVNGAYQYDDDTLARELEQLAVPDHSRDELVALAEELRQRVSAPQRLLVP